MSQKRYVLRALPYVVVVALAVVFYATVWRYALNIPIIDDYLLLFTLARITTPATPVAEALRLLLEQHNDHRILLTRLAVLTDYGAEGQFNVRTLILAGSLSSAGLCWAFAMLFRRAGASGWAVVPVALLLFQPTYHENLWWALSVWQHTVTLLGYVALFALALRSGAGAQVGALALATLLLYSNSNGVVAWVAVVFLLALHQRWRLVGGWAVAGALAVAAYFLFDYQFRSSGSVLSSMRHPVWILKSLIGFLGGAVSFGHTTGRATWLVGVAGLGVILIFSAALSRAFQVRTLPRWVAVLLGMALLLLGTGGQAALARSTGALLIAERYYVYSITALLVAYGLLFWLLPGRWRDWLIGAATLGGAVFCALSYHHYVPLLRDKENALVADLHNVERYGYSPVSNLFLLDPYWNGLFQSAVQRGLYRYPNTNQALYVPFTTEWAKPTSARYVADTTYDALAGSARVALRKVVPMPQFRPEFLLLWAGGRTTFVLPAQTAEGNVASSWFYLRPLPPYCYQLYELHYGVSGWSLHRTGQTLCRQTP